MASMRSRSFWPPRMAVTEAVATPRPTLFEATAAVSLPRRRTRPSEAPEIRTTAAIRPTATTRRRAEAADRRAGGPEAGLAQVAAALGESGVEPGGALDSTDPEAPAGERDQDRGRADRHSESHRAGGEERVVEHEGDAHGDQNGGSEGHAAADALAQALLEPCPGGAAETQEEGDAQEDADRDQAEPDQLPGLGVDADGSCGRCALRGAVVMPVPAC